MEGPMEAREIWGMYLNRKGDIRSSEWKSRIEKVNNMVQGKWTIVFPGEYAESDLPYVPNLPQVGLDDISHLVSESFPITRCESKGDSKEDKLNAQLRGAIGRGYWDNPDYGYISWLPSRLALDLAGDGAAFMSVWYDEDNDFPLLLRLEPDGCYPNIVFGRLVDLIVNTKLNVQQAVSAFPQLKLHKNIDPLDNYEVEIIDYYSDDQISQTAVWPANVMNPNFLDLSNRENPLDTIPIAWAQLESKDGQPRGIFDQVPNILNAQNRIIKLTLDYADQLVYAPMKARGVANLHEKPGPDTIYELLENGEIQRVQPAGPAPQLFALLDFLDRYSHLGAAYPIQRGGEVSQSIASATFVSSTMGQLTSQIRAIQRHLQRIMSRANSLGFQIDEKFLNREKSLPVPVAGKSMYVPKKDIGGLYRNRVVFGAGAGIGELERSTLVLQHQGAKLISKETAREQMDYIVDPQGEDQRIEMETVKEAFLQKIALAEDPAMLGELIAEMAEGKSMEEAIVDLRKKAQEAVREQTQAETAEPTVPTEVPPEQVEREGVALEKGAVPAPAPVVEPKIAVPPTTQVIVAPPRGGR